VSKLIFDHMVRSMQTMHPILDLDWHDLQIDQIELPLEPFKLGVPSGVTKNAFLAYGALGTNCAHILQRN